MNRRKLTGFLTVLSLALLLSACSGGGGGDSGGDEPPPGGSSEWDTMIWDQDNWA